jgi:hypothetical protein
MTATLSQNDDEEEQATFFPRGISRAAMQPIDSESSLRGKN